MRNLGASGAVLAAAVTFSLTALGQTARAPENKPVVVSILSRNTIVPLSRNSFSTITYGIDRYMIPPKRLEGFAEINPVTCTEIAVGAWTPSPDQLCGTAKCGNITTGTETVTEGSGICAGSTFTFATIYYEWTAHNNQSTLPAPPNSVEDTFIATWAAPDGTMEQDTFNINVPVVRPDHETTAFDSWAGPYGVWKQTLVPPSSDPNFDFSGEWVQEFAAGQAGPDMCWFSKSRLDPLDKVTPPQMPPQVLPGNIYSDTVGYGPRNVCIYRNRSPFLKQFGVCGTRFGQEMAIHAPSDPGPTNPPTTWTPYGSTNTGDLNLLGASMRKEFLGEVTSIRAGMPETHIFPTPVVCP